jgi:histidinol dehydrogenase
LKIINGYIQGKKHLSRQATNVYGTVSPGVQKRIKEIFGKELGPEEAVAKIIEDVRIKGDSSLFDLTFKIDGIKLDYIEINRQTVNNAYNSVSLELISALKLAAERIKRFHQEQKEAIWKGVNGEEWGQIVSPLKRVGVYVPGGSASYPSTVLATVIPAKVAGVPEIIITTPPKAEGTVPDITLVAADIAGVDRIFSVGGAQAIAALAYGTNTIPRVDKICGPGNIFVMLAKKQVFGAVGIDALQGPSEVLVIGDATTNPSYCAADLIAQAEHDTLAQSTLITTSKNLADEVRKEIEKQLSDLSRRRIAAESLDKNGTIVIVDNIDEAVELANIYAPEHLELLIENADKYVHKITNAGCIFVGKYSTEPIGDYVAGPSHALPTGGTARFSSPLNILDFIKIIDIVKVDNKLIKQIGMAAITIAKSEGLDAHARAVEKRLEELE